MGVPILLHFNGADASTTFTNDGQSGPTFTGAAGAQLATAQKLFGTASLDCTNNVRVVADSSTNFGAGDFTILLAYYKTGSAGTIISAGDQNNNGTWNCQVFAGNIYFVANTGGGAHTDVINGVAHDFTDNAWNWLCIQRIGTTISLATCAAGGSFAVKGTGTWSSALSGEVSVGDQVIGGSWAAYVIEGYLDEVYINDAAALYPTLAGAAAPTAEFSLSALPARVPMPTPRRRRIPTTFDYSTAGWFSPAMVGAGLFDRDMTSVGGPTNYAITAAQGSYSLSGQTAGLRATRLVTAGQGSYNLTGQTAALRAARRLTAAQGSYSLTGQTVALKFAHLLAAGQGSYSLSGQAAGLLRSYPLLAGQGAYSLTGQAVTLRAARTLLAAQGSYALTGQSARLLRQYRLSAGQGSYSLTGQAAGLLIGKKLSAAQGTYTLTGQDASFPLTRRITAGQGSYALSGQAAMLLATRTMAAGAGSYALNGQAARLLRGFAIAAGQGTYNLNGQSVNFPGQAMLLAVAGSYALTGQSIELRGSRRLSAESGAYSLSGQSAGLTRGLVIPAESGAYSLSGQLAGLNIATLLTALYGSYSLSGKPANLNYSAGIDYEAIAAAVWAYVLPNGKTAAETVVETLELLEAMNGPIEGPYTGNDLLRVIAAVAAGKTTITPHGGGLATVEFRAADDSEVRVTAEMTGSERTEVTLNVD